jgi:hypothetical protein
MEKTYRNPLHLGSLRNKPCPCDSGKKLKRCHGEKYGITEEEAKEINQILVENQKRKNKGVE